MKIKGLVRYMDDHIYLINEIKAWLDNYKIALSKDDFGEMKKSLIFIKSNIENLERLANEI
ncbi:MAG: hypothetical protein AABY22_09480 [Nanoarchaeota archaeon]